MGKVILEVKKKDDQLVLMVSDNGPGLQGPPEEAFSYVHANSFTLSLALSHQGRGELARGFVM